MSSPRGTVLIIEDNFSNAQMAVDLLEDAGFMAFHAEDGDSGLTMARSNHPNVILMDVFMPNKSGLEVIQALKSDADLQDIPVVAFTALGLDEEREKLMAQGCDGVITKPIDVSVFVSQVAAYLSGKHPAKGPPPPAPEADQRSRPQDELQAAQHALKETVALLSHDLQAPARKIHQFCDILLSGDTAGLSEENRMWVERIDRSSQQMLDTLAKSMERFTARQK